MSYETFLASKQRVDPPTGLATADSLPEILKPHQRDIVRWALRRGRAGVFAGTGLGKTLMELTWGDRVAAATGRPVLLFAPLAVSLQHLGEAEKFGLAARLVATARDVGPGVNVTNYQKIDHFDLAALGGVILDESSILKSTDGHYRTRLIAECARVPFRLAATATPQLDVIARCIDLWSFPGETVLTPFLGIGSEVFCAVAMERRGIGFELKPSYFAQAVRNLGALAAQDETGLFETVEARA